ncbi:MAG: BLUF domain-containing protein [Paracoccaceae bacterium]
MPDTTMIVYKSKRVGKLSARRIEEIVAVSRHNNACSGITGLLLIIGDRFFQVLEGPTEAVEAAFARIAADRRHGEVEVLLHRETTRRSFPVWSMAYASLGTGHPFAKIAGDLKRLDTLAERGTLMEAMDARLAA